jgi:probable F420-dependent oxidoreductase
MKVGITLPNLGTRTRATRDNILQIAIQAEKEGFDSVWTITRILWPLKPQSPYPASPDGLLPVEYQTAFDPLDVLAYVAGNTSKISLGTSIVNMFYYTPIMLAKSYATLDVLSQGRVIAGLGLGWSKDEYQASNIPFVKRGERADEFLQVMKKIWTDDIVEFKGKYYSVPASKVEPKPIQKTGIPVYLGGFTPSSTFPRIIKYNLNGWLSVAQFGTGSLKDFENSIKSLKEQASRVNKNPDNFRTIMLTYPKVIADRTANNDNNRYPLTGTIDQIGSDIRAMKEIGVDHMIFDYMFVPIGSNVDDMIDMSKKLSKFAR